MLNTMVGRATTTLGTYLKALREACSLTLRRVEEITEGHVKNSYLSQIEHDRIKKVSPDVLAELAKAYGVDYGSLLSRAGYPNHVPTRAPEGALAGLPLAAVAELDDDDRQATTSATYDTARLE